MQTFKECFAVVMSIGERDELLSNIVSISDHLESYFKQVGDVDVGTADAKLMDAMNALDRLHRRLNDCKYA